MRNDLDVKKTMKIEIAADGLDLDGASTVMREVGPKGEARVEWKAQVERPGEVKFVLKALTDTESDALERKVPVLPYGSPRVALAERPDQEGGERDAHARPRGHPRRRRNSRSW